MSLGTRPCFYIPSGLGETGPETLPVLTAMTARHHAHPYATASRSAAVTHTNFGWSAYAVIASAGRDSDPYIHVACVVTACTAFTHLIRRGNAVDTVTAVFHSMCLCTRRGSCFSRCKSIPREPDGIGIHPEYIGNLPFRAGFESVFPTSSAQTFRMQCG